jgi:hypothetical protein
MERNNSMTARSWLSAGWATFRKDPVRLALVALLWFVWEILSRGLFGSPGAPEFPNHKQIIVFVVGMLFLSVVSVGYSFFCLKLVRGLDAPIGTVVQGFRRWAAALGTAILYGLIVCIGCVLLVVPGIIWGLKYCLAYYALMDRRLSVGQALKLSGKITTGYKGQLFYVGLIYAIPSGAVNLVNSSIYVQTIASLVTTCVLWPWMCCSFAIAYDRLSKEADRIGELAGAGLAKALSIPPDVKRDILSGQYSDTEIMIKYAIGAAELEEMRKTLSSKA